MQQVATMVQHFNHWAAHLPLYLQVFVGVGLFFVATVLALCLSYGLLRGLLRLASVAPLARATSLVGCGLTLVLAWLMYVAAPLLAGAFINHQALDPALLLESVALFAGLYLLICVLLADWFEAHGLWRGQTLGDSTKLFTTFVWLLPLAIPAARRLRALRRRPDLRRRPAPPATARA